MIEAISTFSAGGLLGRVQGRPNSTYGPAPRGKPSGGTGFLAGSFPDGITSIEGEPTPATVRVLYRPEPGAPGDGAVVAEVQSNQDGTWIVEGLNPNLKYDVVGRLKDFNDVIMANVSPVVADEIRWVGKLEWDADLGKVVGMLRFTGGVGPYSVTSVSGLPAGLTPELLGNELTIVGESTEWGEFTGVIGVKDSGGLSADVVVRLRLERNFDPHWDKVVALLHFDGSDGSTLFSDETGRLWAAEGSARISTENKVFGSGSGRFDGSQNTRISSPASPDFFLGTEDFCIEAGVYISGNSALSSGGQRTAAILAIARPQGALLEFSILGDSNKTGTGLGLWNGSTLVSVAGEIAHGEWHRLKVARHGSTFKFFLNGNQLGEDQTAAISFGSATVGVFIGGNVVTGYNFLLNGYIDEFRLTVGESRHTEPSDPPTAPFPNFGPPA